MSRHEQLSNLQSYMKDVDKDITMILQNLQWDRNLLQKERSLSICQYNKNHKMPSNKLKEHEEMCYLKRNGYSIEDTLLPEIVDMNMNTAVKFSSDTIKEILNNAAKKDPLFKRGRNSEAIEPLSMERLQATYTADERRAIHDAVVSAVQYQDSEDFVLPSSSSGAVAGEDKSWLERLAEQRDRRRRRTKYRAPPKTRNYSLVLRDVISAQMELFNELQSNPEEDEKNRDIKPFDIVKKETSDHTYKNNNMDLSTNDTKDTHRYRHSRDKYKEIDHMGRYSSAEDIKSRERDRSRKESGSREMNKYKNMVKYERCSAEDTKSRERDRSRKESSSREMNKYKHMERYDSSAEDNKSRERSRKERSSSREKNKYHEYRSEKRHKGDRYSYGSYGRKRGLGDGKYEVSRHHERDDKDGSYSKKNEGYTHKKDYRY